MIDIVERLIAEGNKRDDAANCGQDADATGATLMDKKTEIPSHIRWEPNSKPDWLPEKTIETKLIETKLNPTLFTPYVYTCEDWY